MFLRLLDISLNNNFYKMNNIIEINDCKYLSEFISELPSHVLLNKGVTGCGGTTVELTSKRNSIILCPSKNLVTSKSAQGYFGVDGDIRPKQIINYIETTKSYKKIIATYDALPKLMDSIQNWKDYFLLVDEYHLLFNDYSFRGDPIHNILRSFRKFNNWCFMTATPLKEEFILSELQDIPQITYKWKNEVPVNIEIIDTAFVQKALIKLIEKYKNSSQNLHIFLNSVTTIKTITKDLDLDYRVVCSESRKSKIKNYSRVIDPIKKINFYTSCAFEGCDIYDPEGLCIILCDTRISTTVLDISTKIRQVCGRLRDSKYNNRCTLILNTTNHRYAGTTKEEFNKEVEKSIQQGKERYKRALENPSIMESELKTYSFDTYSNIYLNKFKEEGKDIIRYDDNLRKIDIYNYNLISEIYSSSISVLGEFEKNNFITSKTSSECKRLDWIIEKLQDKFEYTFAELTEIFESLFQEHGLVWNKTNSIKKYFPEYKKVRRMRKGKQDTYYNFNI